VTVTNSAGCSGSDMVEIISFPRSNPISREN
jgi:hypothetical protein